MKELDEGLQVIQEFLRKRPSLLIGTGLSVSMGLPGMPELREQLKTRIPTKASAKALEEWAECLPFIETLGLEAGLGKSEVGDELLAHIINETAAFVSEKDLQLFHRLFTPPYAEYPFSRLLRHLVISLPPENPILDIITSNYDHSIEYACDKIEVKCCTGFSGSRYQLFSPEIFDEDYRIPVIVTQKGKPVPEYRKVTTVRLLKPHGSLYWQKHGENVFHCQETIGGATCVIITPGKTKYEASLTSGVMNFHREKANQCIRQASTLLVIGYGFNDDHLQTAVLERLSKGMECLIITRSLSTQARYIVAQYQQIIALEEDSAGNTKWHWQGNSGVWPVNLWSLDQFVNKVI